MGAELIPVTARLEDLQRGRFESQSFVSENSLAVFRIVQGKVPRRPAVQQLQLRYWSAIDPKPRFVVGDDYTFRFTPTGEFFDVRGVLRPY
jgi:hypothetical protein